MPWERLRNPLNNHQTPIPQSPTKPLSLADAFDYHDGELYCERVPLAAIAAAVDTPCYVYSRRVLLERATAFLRSAGERALVCYAVKANGNPALIKTLAGLGFGADVTSGGELFLARHAGIAPAKTIYSGVGKKRGEIAAALEAGIRALHVESEMELGVVAEEAERLGRVASIGVRVNPNISAETHPYISTGLHGHKFGVPRDRAVAMLHTAAGHPWLRPVGLAAHIGSQITDLDPFAQSAAFLLALAEELRTDGIRIDYIDAGGGLGIDYQTTAPAISAWVETVARPVQAAGYDLVLEPGRSIVGPTGALLTRATYTKDQGAKRFVIVDAGMTDLIRPTLYQAHHPILPVRESDGPEAPVDIVGPICETSDYLARERPLPEVAAGDLLAVLHAGAYGFAMSSNYNGRVRPAEVLVDGDTFVVIRRRQGVEALLDGCD